MAPRESRKPAAAATRTSFQVSSLKAFDDPALILSLPDWQASRFPIIAAHVGFGPGEATA